jgi:hypothetical protein
MKTHTFMDNAAIGAVLVAIFLNVLHGALTAVTDRSVRIYEVEVPRG